MTASAWPRSALWPRRSSITRPRIPGYGDVNWDRFLARLTEVGYDGPVCIEVEDDTFGKSLAGRQRALKTARNMLAKYFTD